MNGKIMDGMIKNYHQQQVISHSRIAVIKTKNSKFENSTNQHKEE
jgi:hypothetical protein